MKRGARDLGHGYAIIDPPEVGERTLSLAIRAFGPSAFFEVNDCGGARKRAGGKRWCVIGGREFGHGPRCKGKPYWTLGAIKKLPGGIAINEVAAQGSSPKDALARAIRRRSKRAS